MKKFPLLVASAVIVWVLAACSNPNTQEPNDSIPTSPIAQPTISPSDSQSQTSVIEPTPEVVSSPDAELPSSAPSSVQSAALAVAEGLQVRGRSADTNYSREAFGTPWKDVDRNGCDTRNDILKRDFTTSTFKSGTGNCKVIGGTWTDPYSNESYTFFEAPSGAQIDHVVSLKNAWQMGADVWSDQMRVEFANDPLNLRVTIASINRAKSDANAASWLPPYKPGRCNFIATQVAVKAKWSLYVTEAEKQVFISILSKPECQLTNLPN